MRKTSRITITILLALVAVLGLIQITTLANTQHDWSPSSVQAIDEIVWSSAGTAISTTTYYYGPAGNGSQGQNILWWTEAQLFATISIASGQVITVTPQMSADGTNWADVKYKVEEYAGAGVTNTESFQTQTVTRQLVGSADGTDLLAFPLYGKYMRLKTTVVSTSLLVTPTFRLLLKNY